MSSRCATRDTHTSRFKVLQYNIASQRKFLDQSVCKVLSKLGSGRGITITHSRPSGFRRSIETLFLFLPILLNHGLVPSASSSLHTRRGSPPFGGSILITSAPNCLAVQREDKLDSPDVGQSSVCPPKQLSCKRPSDELS
jgi:hypothetical protein